MIEVERVVNIARKTNGTRGHTCPFTHVSEPLAGLYLVFHRPRIDI